MGERFVNIDLIVFTPYMASHALGTIRGKVYVPKVEEVVKPEYDSDDEEEAKKQAEETSPDLDDEYRCIHYEK